jgi:hypothetical protein
VSRITSTRYLIFNPYTFIFSFPQFVIVHCQFPRPKLMFTLFPSNAAFPEIVHRNSHQRVRLIIDIRIITSVSTLIVASRLSSTLVSRLVLNLREQNAAFMQEPTVETMHRFQAALPVSQELLTVESLPSYRPNSSIYETDTIGAFGTPYWSQSVDVADDEV